MNKKYLIAVVVGLMITQAYAVNITINDGRGNGSGWFSANRENNEVEPGNVALQVWDLESFDLTGTKLTLQSGYNFTVPEGYGSFQPGDIFLDVGDNGALDFVVDINGDSYNVVDVQSGATYLSVHFSQNALSNPWRLDEGGVVIDTGTVDYSGTFLDAEGTHYLMSVDLVSLVPYLNGQYTTLHYTMECGNDSMSGGFTHSVPDISSTLLSSFIGLVGLALFRKQSV